jgi:hypothetical protein
MDSLQNFLEKEKNLEIAEKKAKRKSLWVTILAYTSVPIIFFLLWIFLFSFLPYLQETFIRIKPVSTNFESSDEAAKHPDQIMIQEENRVKKLDKTYSRFSTTQAYLIINTSDNTFRLFNYGKLVREGICSTGSFVLLDAGGEKKWMFETPKGMKRIQGKTESPVWVKPDWAFVEEGLPIPKHANSDERFEYGVLGDYALSIGNGYMIHGTLYKRFLGMAVTHGCIRMDDADLEKVYHTLGIGSKVYIF